MSSTPDPDEPDDAQLLVTIGQAFTRALAEALTRRPDLIEGFLADRYRFAVSTKGLLVVENPNPDLHDELEEHPR